MLDNINSKWYNKTMKDNKKYRIVKITSGDKSVTHEVQKKNLFGKWISCFFEYPDWDYEGDFKSVKLFDTFEDAEKAYYCSFVDPIVEVVKEY